MIKHILLVGSGGFVGASLRYLLNLFFFETLGFNFFPLGTLVINVLGCALIGLLSGLIELKGMFSIELRLLLIVGVLGGFTTYSSFGLETYNLMKSEFIGTAFINIFLQLSLGLLAVQLGFKLATYFH